MCNVIHSTFLTENLNLLSLPAIVKDKPAERRSAPETAIEFALLLF